MRTVLAYLLLVVALGSCRLLQPQTESLAEMERTFAELNQAEQLAYLREVLKAQSEKIRQVRIARVKSLKEELSHEVELTVTSIDQGFRNTKLPYVRWSRVQADSVELLRCKQENIGEQRTVSGKKSVVEGDDFVKLQQEPHTYGFIACDLVYGDIQDGVSLVDYSAENKFRYVYFFRPCFRNYALVAATTADTSETTHCGDKAVAAAENSSEALDSADKTVLVFRYCQKDKHQVCSRVISRSEEFDFNHGVQKLPLELFEQRRKLKAKIAQHEEEIHNLGSNTLEKLIELHDVHKARNQQREDNVKSTENVTGMLNQAMAGRFGREMSFRGTNCYEEDKKLRKAFDDTNKGLRDMHAANEAKNPSGKQFEEIELGWEPRALNVAVCLASNVPAVSNFVKQRSTLSAKEQGLAVVNFAIDWLPLENSKLNQGSSSAAFAGWIADTLKKEEDYFRQYCIECLEYLNEIKYHNSMLSQLYLQLNQLGKRIQNELTTKGVEDPDAR